MKHVHDHRRSRWRRAAGWRLRHAAGGRRPRFRSRPGPKKPTAPKPMPGAIYAQGTDVHAVEQRHRAQRRRHTDHPPRGKHRGREELHAPPPASPPTATLTGPDGRRPAGHRSTACRFSRVGMDNQPEFAGNGDSDAEQQARRLHHRDGRQALVQRQPAGARPEVDRASTPGANSCACRASCARATSRRTTACCRGKRGRRLHLLWRAGHGGQCHQARLAVPLLQFTELDARSDRTNHARMKRLGFEKLNLPRRSPPRCCSSIARRGPGRTREGPGLGAGRAQQPARGLRPRGRPRRHRRPDQPGAVHHPEHQEHAGRDSASPFRRTPTRSSRTWPRSPCMPTCRRSPRPGRPSTSPCRPSATRRACAAVVCS